MTFHRYYMLLMPYVIYPYPSLGGIQSLSHLSQPTGATKKVLGPGDLMQELSPRTTH